MADNLQDILSGLELDQQLAHAIAISQCEEHQFDEEYLLMALLEQNTTLARFVDPDRLKACHWYPQYAKKRSERKSVDLRKVSFVQTVSVLQDAITRISSGRTLGTLHFLEAVASGVEADNIHGRSGSAYAPTLIYELFGGTLHEHVGPGFDRTAALKFLDTLRQSLHKTEDFQYVLAFQDNRIAFRIISVLDDYVQNSESGLFIPQRALLTHFKDQFGCFTQEEVEELEELLNNPKAKEHEFQTFFERNTHFFRRWDYREVYTQVHLRRDDEGDLIPDFILTDHEAQKAAIVELKLPKAKLIRRHDNRDRFATALQEARAQLITYKRWFQESQNRALIKERVGMEIYEPHLSVIIGRASEFQSALDRQTLRADHSDIEVVTFDDILRYAKRRQLLINRK